LAGGIYMFVKNKLCNKGKKFFAQAKVLFFCIIIGIMIFFSLSFSGKNILEVNVAKAACVPGNANCDCNAATGVGGCEVDLTADINNCGECGRACGSDQQCLYGQCAYLPLPPSTGGLVPCGRNQDDINTGGIDESAPCNLCTGFYMLKLILNFIMALSGGILLLILVVTGLVYAFSVGNPGRIQKAKDALKYALMGFTIIFIS